MVAETEGLCPWTFEDLCLWTYCLVDELWVQLAPAAGARDRPRPVPMPNW